MNEFIGSIGHDLFSFVVVLLATYAVVDLEV